MGNKLPEIVAPRDGNFDFTIIEDMLKKEALQFIVQNSTQLFKLGDAYVKAILFQEVNSYVDIPSITDPNNLVLIVEREKYLTARDKIFQLVAKAELENYETAMSVRKNALIFIGEIMKKLGVLGLTYLFKMMLVAVI